ncbi:hypothetical protein [Cystobacter fuscus]|uniref:hypothetical protein n=1 Tax=Cystobacter fuscus TaxID=43 RepID=UPI0037C1A220
MRSYGEELIEQGRQQGLAQGLSRGRGESILRILNIRGIHVEEGVRQRILDCTDVDTLNSWFDRALQATTLSEVLDGGAQAPRRKDS